MNTEMRVRDIPAVLLSAARILRTYWAPFVVIACLGLAVRSAAMWLAVIVSDFNGFLAQLILVIAPLGFLGAMIAMLYMTRGALPNVEALSESEGPQAVTEQRERRLVDVAVSVLVPFLAVYVSYGLLKEDLFRFTNEAAYAEFNQFSLNGDVEYDFASRLAIYDWQIVLAIVGIAWVLRFALGKIESVTKFLGLAFLGALVEVYYTSQVAQQVTEIRDAGQSWVENRRAARLVLDQYDSVVSSLGPLANPVDTATAWLFGLLGAVDAVVIVPLAWLTVGAVVLGHKLSPPETPAAQPNPRWERVPAPVRRWGGGLVADVRERWSAFWNGLRMMATAGLLPMLTFSLAFLLVLRIPWLVSQLLRWAIGPLETKTWLAIAPMEKSVGLALTMVLAAALLAAAIDWLLGPRLAEAAEPEPNPAPAADQVSAAAVA
ncbi:hypothetical protein [Knoellia subterranea]|uniref:Uncharacterized protein n=1 Tax=Knoellia subterranea KCTC 19937 TaxID=1385521 RepID=A0A0A0JKH1_9MICO|nr:hypothetical protein [Knoellia subterranea]KGN37940.1 hypothetical protein N803_12830 [Knoellia subterranea KCTC 19937]